MASKNSDGLQPISKNQKNKFKNANKKHGTPSHGGTCSACGQTSTSCTTNSPHEGCRGWSHQEELSDDFLELTITDDVPEGLFDRLEGRYMRADGLLDDGTHPGGVWMRGDDLKQLAEENLRQQREEEELRAEAAAAADYEASLQVCFWTYYEADGSFAGYWTNGLMEPIATPDYFDYAAHDAVTAEEDHTETEGIVMVQPIETETVVGLLPHEEELLRAATMDAAVDLGFKPITITEKEEPTFELHEIPVGGDGPVAVD